MAIEIKIKRGLDIPLDGKAAGKAEALKIGRVGINPDDYPGYTWKCEVKPGEKVAKGAPIFHAKEAEEIKIVAPEGGIVEDVRRGERRKILYVIIKTEGGESAQLASETLKGKLLESGLWSLMRQRPYDIVPDPAMEPRDIFVTAFDSAPLASEVLPAHLEEWLEAGLEALRSLTKGKVYLGVRKDQGLGSRAAEVLEIEGPHPAGNVGTQISAVAPVNKGETVWALDAGTAARIGLMAKKGVRDFLTEVSITGPEAISPKRVISPIGSSLNELLKGEIDPSVKCRVISGNVLTGIKENPEEGFLRFPYRQVTIIKEGDNADEFMGWASMNPNKFSVKRTFPGFLKGLGKHFDFDTRVKGGHRAMILSGELDKVFPFDIYPEYLIKAMLAGDYDKMEKLGIYEIAPEDFALAEFVDTSKQELQHLTRESLDRLRKDS